MKNTVLLCVFLSVFLVSSRIVFSCEVAIMNERNVLPEEISGKHEGRIESYKTFELMSLVEKFLNNYYKNNDVYPELSDWALLASKSSTELKLSDDGVSILDGYGDPIVYIYHSQKEIEFYSVNLFEKDEENKAEEAIVYYLKSGEIR